MSNSFAATVYSPGLRKSDLDESGIRIRLETKSRVGEKADIKLTKPSSSPNRSRH